MGHRRSLSWSGCYNVRDLGGLAVAPAGRTRFRTIVRADNVCRLTQKGWTEVVEYGVRTVVDLRSPSEIDADLATRPSMLASWNVPLLDESDIETTAAIY